MRVLDHLSKGKGSIERRDAGYVPLRIHIFAMTLSASLKKSIAVSQAIVCGHYISSAATLSPAEQVAMYVLLACSLAPMTGDRHIELTWEMDPRWSQITGRLLPAGVPQSFSAMYD